MSNKPPVIRDKHFIETYVENVEFISLNEVYWRNEDGSRGQRVCGAIREDGKRCLLRAGDGTGHQGVGMCFAHDKGNLGRKGWLQLVGEAAKTTTLGNLIDRSEDLEVSIGEVNDEIRLQQILILSFVQDVVEKKGGNFSKEDLKFLKDLNLDMIHSKESAARIKGSMKLDAVTVKQFANQILTFLFGRLSTMVGKAEALKLASDMNKEVFTPMIARSLISGEVKALEELPRSLEGLSIPREQL